MLWARDRPRVAEGIPVAQLSRAAGVVVWRAALERVCEETQGGAVGEEEELVQVKEGGLRTGVNGRCEERCECAV